MNPNLVFPSTFNTQQELAKGEILSPQALREAMPQAKSLRDIPMLSAEFNTKILDSDIKACHLGYGSLNAIGIDILTVRLQFNAAQFYWLANPADPDVQALMHAWEMARVCGVAVSDKNGRCALQYAPFSLHPQAREAMAKSEHGPASLQRFQEALSLYCGSDALRRNASSDIKSVPRLTEVKVALLTTQFTTGPGNGFTQQPQMV